MQAALPFHCPERKMYHIIWSHSLYNKLFYLISVRNPTYFTQLDMAQGWEAKKPYIRAQSPSIWLLVESPARPPRPYETSMVIPYPHMSPCTEVKHHCLEIFRRTEWVDQFCQSENNFFSGKIKQ